jgi:hypothetical protein
MDPKDRATLPGNQGRTTTEINAKILAGQEKELQKQIYGFLRCLGIIPGYSNPSKKTTYTEGWPDFVFPYRDRFICWECKTIVGKLSPDQVKVRQTLELQSVTSYRVITGLAQAQEHLREIDAQNNKSITIQDIVTRP